MAHGKLEVLFIDPKNSRVRHLNRVRMMATFPSCLYWISIRCLHDRKSVLHNNHRLVRDHPKISGNREWRGCRSAATKVIRSSALGEDVLCIEMKGSLQQKTFAMGNSHFQWKSGSRGSEYVRTYTAECSSNHILNDCMNMTLLSSLRFACDHGQSLIADRFGTPRMTLLV